MWPMFVMWSLHAALCIMTKGEQPELHSYELEDTFELLWIEYIIHNIV